MNIEDILKKRIIVFGANGMLGQRTVLHFLNQPNIEVFATDVQDSPAIEGIDYQQADITDRQQVKKVVYDFYPDYIINAAAYTAVDKCEEERELSWKVNVKAVEHMAETARVLDARLVHISTDYVFDGKKGPYEETDKPNPISYYGRTKLASENALRISGVLYTALRTNVLYGIVEHGRKDFVRWVVESLREGKPLRIVDDQINNPTYIDDLVQAISKSIEFKKTGMYHTGGKEFLSRFDFTLRIADFFGLDKSLLSKITTEELGQRAPRPLKSGLITLKAESEFGYSPHSFEESFALMNRQLTL